MHRLGAVGDHHTHLWLDTPPTRTACGRPLIARSGADAGVCPGCVHAFGLEVADAFPDLVWLRSYIEVHVRVESPATWGGAMRGFSQHAFEHPDMPDEHGYVEPVCGMRSYRAAILRPDPMGVRCANCIRSLRTRLNRVRPLRVCSS